MNQDGCKIHRLINGIHSDKSILFFIQIIGEQDTPAWKVTGLAACQIWTSKTPFTYFSWSLGFCNIHELGVKPNIIQN